MSLRRKRRLSSYPTCTWHNCTAFLLDDDGFLRDLQVSVEDVFVHRQNFIRLHTEDLINNLNLLYHNSSAIMQAYKWEVRSPARLIPPTQTHTTTPSLCPPPVFGPPAKSPGNSTPLVPQSCAVVGNSGNLKLAHFGDAINSHTAVLRTNQVCGRLLCQRPEVSDEVDRIPDVFGLSFVMGSRDMGAAAMPPTLLTSPSTWGRRRGGAKISNVTSVSSGIPVHAWFLIAGHLATRLHTQLEACLPQTHRLLPSELLGVNHRPLSRATSRLWDPRRRSVCSTASGPSGT